MSLLNISDQELIQLIKEDHENLAVVYRRCKDYCISFMRKRSSGIDDDDLNDIFQNAMIILYENIVSGNFELTASIQTYLNSVCRFQLLNKFRSDKKTVNQEDDTMFDKLDKNMQYDASINDILEPIEDEKETQFNALDEALKALKKAGGHCYELLTLFWYHKKSLNELTAFFGYSNSDNTRHQKARCQKRLKRLAFNILNE